MSDSSSIPIVSFAPFLSDDRASQQQVAKQVYNAFSSIGFIYLKDHGIPQGRVDEMFRLADRFFSLPLETKNNYKLNNPRVNQGYTAEGAEGINDHKECYEHRRFTNDLCPSETDLVGFRSTLDDFYAQCFSLAMNVLK